VIRGERTGLRARQASDVPVLHAELYDDHATRTRTDPKPWRPLLPEASPFLVEEATDTTVPFSVVDLATGELAGAAVLWGIDRHNRSAHLGISLLAGFRGRGFGTDTVRTLCRYGFDFLGMRRIQAETLAGNTPMLTAARHAGITVEGTLRRSAWVYGAFVDEVILGLLVEEWKEAARRDDDR
jgi:RimJ/RimL family protein N-acetyltransferase